jgi:hypothetical protein
MWGEDNNKKSAGFEGVLNDAVLALPRSNVALIHPDIETLVGEIVYQAGDEFGINPGVTDENLSWHWHGILLTSITF